MRRWIVCLMFTMTLLVGSAGAQHTVDDIDYDTVSNPDNLVRLLRDLFDQLRSTWIRLTPQTTAPTAQEGKVYYNDTANQLYFSADGSTWTALAAGSGNSLGAAYTLGSKIDADTDVVEIEVADGSNNVALLIDHDEAQNDNDAVQITNAADATTAVSLQIDGTAGYDIQGTGDSWNISIAGAASLVGITNTAADCLWDDTYDMSWDTSLDQLLFEDNAVLGIGGAHDAAGDVTFKWDATNLLIEANADNTGQIRMGSTNAIDFAVYGSTNTNIVLFDVSEAIVESNGWAWVIQDDDDLRFGDSDEFVVEYDEDGTDNLVVVAANANDAVQIGDCTTGTDFIMVGSAAADNTTHKAWFDASGNTNEGIMKFGVDDHGLDVEFYGETTSQLVTWDQSADTWYFGDDAEGVDVYLNADTTGDFFLWDESDEALEGVGVQLHLDDASPLQLGSTAGDVYLQFDGTNFLIDASTASEGMLIGDATSGFDVAYRFETAGEFRTDYDADFINLTDDMDLRFGTGASADGDFMISSDSSNVLNISQVVADTGTITIGANGTDVPLSWYAETTGDFVRLTGDDFQLEDVSLCLGEGTQIQFGDNLGTGDVTMACASNLLTIGQVVAGTGAVALGANDAGMDFTFYGDTTGQYLLWDTSEDSLLGNLGNVLFTTVDAEVNQFKVDATGAGAGNVIVLETTDGGVQVNADGGDNGDIALDAADDMTLTAAGDLTLAVTGTYSHGGAQVTNTLQAVEVVTTETNALTAAESGKCLVSNYTGTQTHTLPDAAAGLIFTFVDNSSTAADDMVIDCQAGDNIDHDTNGDAIQSVTDAYPQTITLIALNGTDWATISKLGTWGQQ